MTTLHPASPSVRSRPQGTEAKDVSGNQGPLAARLRTDEEQKARSVTSQATQDVQEGARRQASAIEQQQKQSRLQAPVSPAATEPKRGLMSPGQEASGAAALKAQSSADPKTKPVMVLAPQFGDGKSDEIVKASYERVKASAEKNGFDVIDAPNLTGDALKEKVKAGMQDGHTGPLVVWTGGHGDVVQDKGEKKTEHELTAQNKDGSKDTVRTGDDILRPIFDGAQEKTGAAPHMTAFVGSCRSGEAANDLAETFTSKEQQTMSVVTSSGRDQLSNGDGLKGVEAATMALTDMMASDSRTRQKADGNQDGAVSAQEFATHVNAEGGGLAVPRERDVDGDQRPDEITLDAQTIEVAGQGANPLIPKGTGVPGWKETAGPGEDAPRPMTKEQARGQAKELQKYLAAVYGQTPKIVDNTTTASGVTAQVDATGRDIDAGPTKIRDNNDGSKRITSPATAEHPGYDETIAPGGKTGTFSSRDQDGKVLESGTATYDGQGRPLTRTSQFPKESHLASVETTSQYDDAAKPTSTTVARYKNGTTVTTFDMNAAGVQGPWHQNSMASQTQVHGTDGKMWEMTSTFNRPDGPAQPFVQQEQQFMDPTSGRPYFQVQTMSTGKRAFIGPDGNAMSEAAAKKANPWFFAQQ